MPRKSVKEAPSAAQKEPTSAVGRAFDILRILRRATTPLALTTIAEELGIAPSSAHSVLAQLLRQEAVVLDGDKRYALGPGLFYLGSAYSRGSGIYRVMWTEMIDAANEMAVTAALAVPWENHHLIIATHRALNGGVSVPVGGRVPIDGGSWGKVYYVWSGAEVPKTLHGYTSSTITDRSAYVTALEDVRQAGYARDLGEFAEDVVGVCAPVTSSRGFEGVATFLAPTSRTEELPVATMGSRLSSLAARASRALGDSVRVPIFGEG
jgi:DNA-binding IclR family transcriptional regulator